MPRKKQVKRGRPRTYRMPEKIDASPEEVAAALLRTPPKKAGEWRYQQEQEQEYREREKQRPPLDLVEEGE